MTGGLAEGRRLKWHRPRFRYGQSNPSKTRAMAHRKQITATLRRALSDIDDTPRNEPLRPDPC